MTYQIAKKFQINFSARWVEPPTDLTNDKQYFILKSASTQSDYPTSPPALFAWPFQASMSKATGATTATCQVLAYIANKDVNDDWHIYRVDITFVDIALPVVNTWKNYELSIEYPGDPTPVGDKTAVNAYLKIDGVNASITGSSPLIFDVYESFAGTASDPEYMLMTPLDGVSFIDPLDDGYDNAVEYDNMSWQSSPLFYDVGVDLVATTAFSKLDVAVNPMEIIVGPYFSPSYIADDYVADGTLASSADIDVDYSIIVEAAAALAADFQTAVSGGTQKDITLTAFGDAVLTAAGDKVSLGTATLECQSEFAVAADLASDLTQDLASAFTVTVSAAGRVNGQATLATDSEFAVTATRLIDIEVDLASDFQSTCLAGRIVGPVELYPTQWQDIAEWDQWPFGVWEKRGLLMASVFEGLFNGGKIVDGAAGVDADSQISALGGYLTEGAAALESDFQFEPGIGKLTGGAALVISDVALTADAVVVLGAIVDLAGDFQTAAAAVVVFDESVSFESQFDANIQARRFLGITQDLAASTAVTAQPGLIHGGQATFDALTAVLSVGTIFKVDEYRTIRVLPESRAWNMVRETRQATVNPQSRTWLVEGYEI